MLMRRARVYIAVATAFGLSIGLPFGWAFLQFTKSSREAPKPPPEEHGQYVDYLYAGWLWITHDAAGFFTLFLCIITAVLARYTYRLFRSTAQISRDTREASAKALEASTAHTQTLFNIERAYLAGGGECQRYKGQIQWSERGERLFRLKLGNHGKTPAFLTAYGIHFCTLEEARKGPQPVRRQTHTDQFPPGELYRDVGPVRPITQHSHDIVYGAFWYRDIWGEPHCYRYILRIAENGQTYADVTGVHARYTRQIYAKGRAHIER
jgi:hypothetical protein